jgi:hypothetical protein
LHWLLRITPPPASFDIAISSSDFRPLSHDITPLIRHSFSLTVLPFLQRAEADFFRDIFFAPFSDAPGCQRRRTLRRQLRCAFALRRHYTYY